jgi:hypothetical protein
MISIISVDAVTIPRSPIYLLISDDLKFIRNPDFPPDYSNPIENVTPIPQHPYMAKNGGNNMHGDAYMSDYILESGPLGIDPIVHSTFRGIAECVTICYTSENQMVTGCTSLDRPRLILMDSTTLEEIKRYNLPVRPLKSIFDPIKIYEDTSGGAYFYLDNENRVVVATHEQAIEIVQVPSDGGNFELVEKINLSDYVVYRDFPERDKVGCALPDWHGNIWFTTRYGAVGAINKTSGKISSIELKEPITQHYEEIQNSFTVGEDGVYIVSDYALYRFNIDVNSDPKADWRIEYDRGTRRKPGMLNQGSGTTPTLVGDFVVIGDNADPKMNVQFHYRSNGTLVEKIPIFEDFKSCSENSPIGLSFKNGSCSVIFANNYGHKGMLSVTLGRASEPGITRIDLIKNKNKYEIKKVWTSSEIPISALPKLSIGNGMFYIYSKDPHPFGLNLWYFTAIDFRTGETVFKKMTGTGFTYNNNWGPIHLSPDGTAYIGMLLGMVSVRDGN